MKFKDVRTIESLLKEYGMTSGPSTSVGNQKSGSIVNKPSSSSLKKPSTSIVRKPSSNKTIQPKDLSMTTSKAGDLKKDFVFPDEKGNELKIVSPAGKRTSLPNDKEDVVIALDKNNEPVVFDKDADVSYPEVQEGKLKKLAKKKGKKFQIRKLKGKIKKLSKKRLKEADPKLFEINFNKKEIASEALDMPVKCGFEAETFFYSVDGSGSSDVDDMSISDIEYEYGDLPDQAYEDYQDWLYDKGQSEYLDDLVSDKVQEVKEDEEWLNDFIDSSSGPSSEAIEIYKKDFEEADPQEYENREEDGWEYMNWVREYVEEEYEDEYLEWLDLAVREEYDLNDEAREAAESDYSMEDWIYDTYSYMSSFLDEYGYDYSRGGSGVSDVADELYNGWIKQHSSFDEYPESGDYGDTYTTTSWAVETDSSIDPDEGAAAELISPVYSSPRKMLEEMRSLFNWSEDNFGTNNTTGLHVTMSWNGSRDGDAELGGLEPNKLKMALLLGDEYLLAQWGRRRNSYTKSQYQNLLKHAEDMKRGNKDSFLTLQKELEKGISREKFSSIHFKNQKDNDSENELIEFRIMGGADYNTMYEKVVKSVVRYATIMNAGYDEDAFRTDYINALFRLIRKSQEIDPEKTKELEVHNHPVIDSAKEIVGKKDYFDVIRFLNNSVNYFNEYEELSDPDADKKWKQSVKDYEKGTGDKMDIVEVEEGEPIRGYIQPDAIAPSKRAPAALKRSQEMFGRAVTLLARDIADNKARGMPNAKSIRIFREYANKIKLNSKTLEKIAIQSMDDLNFNGTDKENIVRLEKGVQSLFKQDIIKKPTFLTPQEVDAILKKSWQFAMSDDKKDNIKLNKFIELLVKVSPYKDTDQVQDDLRQVFKTRQENEFARYMKSGSYGSSGLLKAGKITTPGAVKELLSFLEPYSGYEHPTSPDHHINIRSDDNYENVAQMRMIQRMRDRMDHLQDLQTEDKEKYQSIVKQLQSIGQDFITALKPVDFQNELGLKDNDEDGRNFLGISNFSDHDDRLSKWNDILDDLTKMSEPDQDTWNFPKSYDDLVFSQINLSELYKAKSRDPGNYESSEIKALIKERFAAIKKFLTGFDKIFQKEGFLDLKSEIKNKNQLDKRNKDFEKNIRGSEKTKFNIPSHSWVYIDKEFFDTITDEDYNDREAYLENHLEHFNEELNTGKVYVIAASHFGDAEDATNGLELIDTFEKNKNYYHSWRRTGYNKILSKFKQTYGISWRELTGERIADKTLIQGDGDVYQKLKEIGIAITHKGDSRKGMDGVQDLVPDNETENPRSGEPLNRSSSMSWENINDDAEEKRFNAFDWSVYPEQMKGLVAKEMKDKISSFGSFQVALDNILKRVLDGDTGIEIGPNKNSIIKAADVEGYTKEHSAKIGAETDWINLADHLGIELGVNNQGAELLKKTYNMYDENTQGNFAADGVSIERWLDAVQKSKEYIQKNYTVSGGNYFRDKDYIGGRLGGPEDAEKTISTPPEKEFNSDYDLARNRWPKFDEMMRNGMQNYLARGSVNDLVGFLNNASNDRRFQNAVLDTLADTPDSGMGAFDDFQSVLASARMNMSRQNQESVLDKFDKLPLQERLRIINESDVLEKWSKKYKDSINCSNPKGFSQKAHCDGKKKQEGRIEDTFATDRIDKHDKPQKKKKKEKMEEGALPDNSVVRMLNKLLAEPMPASDIKKQMDAYFALPVPSMLKAFRDRRSEGGDDACLRPILRSYIKQQLDPSSQKQVNLNEGIMISEYEDLEAEKIKIQDIIKQLDIEDEKDRGIIDQIWRILNSDHIQTVIGSVVARPIADETAMDKLEATKILTKVIYQVEGSYDKIKSFLDDLEKTGSAYDVDAIKKPINALSNVFKSDVGFTVFKTLLPYGVGSNRKGPGEFALAMLSDRVQLSDSTGDIKVDGDLVEVKASKSETSSGGGRLGMHGLTGDDATARLLKYENDIPSIAQHLKDPRNKTLGFGKFLEYLNTDLPVGDKRRGLIVKDLYTGVFIPKAVQKIAKAVQSSNQSIEIAKQYAGANYIDYVSKGKFDSLLAIDLYTGKTAYMKSEDEFIEFIEGPHSGSLGVSAVSSNSNPAEVFVQMKFKKGKV